MDLGAYIAYSQPLFDWAEYDKKLLQNELLRARIDALRARSSQGRGPSLGNQRFILNLMNSIKGPDKLHPVAEREWNEIYNDFLNTAALSMQTGDISGLMEKYAKTIEAARRVKYNSQQYQKFSEDVEKGSVPVTKEEHEVWLRGEADLPFSVFRSSDQGGASGVDMKVYSPSFNKVPSLREHLTNKVKDYFKTHGLGNIKDIRPGLLFMTTNAPKKVLREFVEEYASDLNQLRSNAYEFYRSGKYSKALEEDKEIEDEAIKRANDVVLATKKINNALKVTFGVPLLPDIPVTKALIDREKQNLIEKYKEELRGEGAERATSYMMIPEIKKAVIDNDEKVLKQIEDVRSRRFLIEYSRYLKKIIDEFNPSKVSSYRYSVQDGYGSLKNVNLDVSVNTTSFDGIGVVNISGALSSKGRSIDNAILVPSRSYIISDIMGGDLTENLRHIVRAGANISLLSRPPIEVKISDLDISIVPVARRDIPSAGIKKGQILNIEQIIFGKESGVLKDGDVVGKAYIQGSTVDGKNSVYVSFREAKPKLYSVYGRELVDKIIDKGVERFKDLYGLEETDLYDNFEDVKIPKSQTKVSSIRNIINSSKR